MSDIEDKQELINLIQTSPYLDDFREAFPNPEQDIPQFASRAQISYYDLSGYQLMRQGEIGREFFLIMSGQTRAVDMTDSENPSLVAYMTRGHFTGLGAMMGDNRTRSATVEVVTKAKVAMFNESDWHWLMNKNSIFRDVFTNLQNNRFMQAKMDFPGRQPDEVVIVATKRHFVAFIATLPLPLTLLIAPIIFFLIAEIFQIQFLDVITYWLALLATLPFVIVAALLTAYNYFDWRNDDLIVTTKRVVHIERILFYGEQRRDAPLARIQDVTTDSDIFDLLFDADNLKITTAGVGSIEIHHIMKADEVRQAIIEQADQAKARVTEADVSALQHRIARQLDWEDKLPNNVLPPAEEEWNDQVEQPRTRHYGRIIDYFIPRVKEVDDVDGSTVITWRKHRYILFVNIILPTVLLIGAIYLSFFVGPIFPLQVILGIAILASFGWYIWAYDDWHKDLYQVTDSQIIDIDSSAFRLRRTRRDGSFDSIQNVYTEVPNLFYKLLNMGHVIIETAGSEETFTFRNVFNPTSVNKEIFNRWSLYQQRQREQSRESTTKQVLEVLKEYHNLSQKLQ